jgi:hypothetical protein
MRTSYTPPSSLKSALPGRGLWVLLSAAGLALGHALSREALTLIHISPGVSTMSAILARILISSLLHAIPYAFAQWIFLRSLPGMWLWPLATAATYPFIQAAIVGVGLGVGNIIDTSANVELGKVLLELALAAFVPSLLYIPMGVAQWPLLRRHFDRASLWIPATYAAWLLAILVLYLTTLFAVRSGGDIRFDPALVGAMVGAVQAAITGVALFSLGPRPQADPPGS